MAEVTGHKAKVVGREAETIRIADAVEDVAKALTTSLDLAVDCLQFSTHFFHPIQQCAQQVYHTALPLSPTSSQLRNFCLQNVIDNQLSHVAAFLGAPKTWGFLLRTIDFRPRQLTCIATSAQMIVAACGDIVNSYDAITFVLKQSLHAPEAVTKIQGNPDGSALFFAHSHSVTMWDVQTGGLTHTFTMGSEITDVAVSTTGDHIACGSSDSFVIFWNVHTKEEGEGFGNGQPVVAICWLGPQEVTVTTQNSVYIRNIAAGKTQEIFSTSDRVWGIVCSVDKQGVLVVTSQPGAEADQELSSLTTVEGHLGTQYSVWRRSRIHRGRLLRPTLAGKEIACITPPSGVQSFNIQSYFSTNNPPLLGAATSVAVSLNRNLVAQTKDSLQIFSLNVLTSRGVPETTVRLWGRHPHTITKGKLVPFSEPRAAPTYTLDANCEWVIDAESRKICWIPPGNVRRGDGGHVWAGLSLVMIGDDGVVRKLSFRELDS
jgi:WD40 repeat protein